MKILLTTTSFQDTPGKHHELLKESGYEVDKMRGPVSEEVLIPIIGNYDAVICGDDEYSHEVIKVGKEGKLKAISKYGVGLDKIDLIAAKEYGIPVFNTPGINQGAVAEHTLALLFTHLKNTHLEYNITKAGQWNRITGNELAEKKVGIFGLGKIGQELAKRLSVFGVELIAYDITFDNQFLKEYSIKAMDSIEELVLNSDILCIHAPLTEKTKHSINSKIINKITQPVTIVNTSRALILEQKALLKGLLSGKIKAYLTDVMDEEPMQTDHPLKDFSNVIITPHIGSRTFENVEKQGCKAISNLTTFLNK